MKKVLVIGVILLFLGVSVTSSLGISNSIDDTTPPVTTCTLDPPEPNGWGNWYISDINVTLNATDDMSGVKEIHYRIAEGEWEVQAGDLVIFILDHDCLINSSIEFYAIDFADNQEETKIVDGIYIDQLPPNIELTYEIIGGNPCQGWDILITVGVTDDCSGIGAMVRIEFDLNDVLQEIVTGPGPIYQWGFKYWGGLKITVGVFCCCDNAGNYAYKQIQIKSIQNSIQQSIHPLFLRLIERFPFLEQLLNVLGVI